jgi:hypothetical protein
MWVRGEMRYRAFIVHIQKGVETLSEVRRRPKNFTFAMGTTTEPSQGSGAWYRSQAIRTARILQPVRAH